MFGVWSLRILITSLLDFWWFIVWAISMIAIDEPNYPADLDQSFLLIACTGRIVTHASLVESNCEYRQILLTGFPAYGRMYYRAVTRAGGSLFPTLGPFILVTPSARFAPR